jgi:HAE1 family hydrophobic/amphiphilic exporter-1
LTHIASIIPTSGRGTIRHSEGIRSVTVSAQLIAGTNIRDVVEEFDSRAAEINLPPGVNYTWVGEAADLDESMNTMTINFVLALLTVFLILAVQFNSFSQPLIILITVPMSIIRVLIGLLITGNNFGLYAFMGVIALVGIVVNDAIVLMDTINRNRKEGMKLEQSLSNAGRIRFAPVLATSLTTIGGMLPLAFRDENFAQLSISLISGLLASTILTLLVLPLIYRNVYFLKNAFQQKVPILIDDETEEIGNEN